MIKPKKKPAAKKADPEKKGPTPEEAEQLAKRTTKLANRRKRNIGRS